MHANDSGCVKLLNTQKYKVLARGLFVGYCENIKDGVILVFEAK